MSENARLNSTPVTMLALRTLIVTTLPLLVSSSTFQRCLHHNPCSHFSPVLDSLQCYNDFTTHIRCTWEEDVHTQLHLPVVLENTKEYPCVLDSRSALSPSGKIIRSCLHKTGYFILGSYTIFFNTSVPAKSIVFNVAQQGKVLSPVNLTVREDEGGGRVLRWSSPYAPSSGHILTYQLKYRRHGHEWTVVNNMSNSELVIEKTALLPGYVYEARVRARGRVGLWSDWSPPVSWMTEEEGVLNLQCVLEDDGLTCSWQVKIEHAQVFSYNLCWKIDGDSQKCEPCTIHAGELQGTDALLDYTCSVVSSMPERLTVEIQSVRVSKTFQYPLNFQPPRPPAVQVDNSDGIWKVRWSEPKISNKVQLSYQVCVRRNDTEVGSPEAPEECYNITDIVFSFDIPHSILLHQTEYMAQVRTLPGKGFAGRPSDWSEAAYFTTDSAPWTNTIIYVLVGVFVLMFSIILYNTLPACHRRLELWKVSIPSPIKSRVLEEMSNKKLPVGWAYSANEKTSHCIIQASDNPIIYKGRILEYPLLPYVENSGSITLMKADWRHSSASEEGSGSPETTGMSFLGPYLLCRQESSSQTESSSVSSFDEENAPGSESVSDSSPVKEGYVFSPPAFLPSPGDSATSDPPSLSREPSELPQDGPPAYSPSPPGTVGIIFSHPSGYCLMPTMDLSGAVWTQAPVQPPESGPESQSCNTAEGDEHACSYVTLSQPWV